MRVAEHRHRLPREAGESPSVVSFNVQLDMVLGTLQAWDQTDSEVPALASLLCLEKSKHRQNGVKKRTEGEMKDLNVMRKVTENKSKSLAGVQYFGPALPAGCC